MHTVLRLGMIILFAGLAAVGSASPAAAGGPTSVLIAFPATQRTASAYYSDERYERLARYVGIDTAAGVEQPSSGESPPPGLGSNFGSEVRLTWLIHDMSVWRIDRIHIFVGDVIWIQTSQSWSDDPEASVWHRAAEPNKLHAALAETGVLKNSAIEPAPESQPTEQSAVAPASGPPTAALIGISGMIGVGLGVAVSYLFRRPRGSRDQIVLTG